MFILFHTLDRLLFLEQIHFKNLKHPTWEVGQILAQHFIFPTSDVQQDRFCRFGNVSICCMSGYRKGRKKFRRHFVNCNSSFQGRDVFKRSQKDVVLWLVSPLSVSSSMVKCSLLSICIRKNWWYISSIGNLFLYITLFFKCFLIRSVERKINWKSFKTIDWSPGMYDVRRKF